MADLPSARVTSDQPPFTCVGVDYFGPFLVRQKRSQVKRYGVIFTCLAMRAVHLEISHSLDTNSFILALRRLIARRGQVKEIRSDNGTNFVGGEKELCVMIESWNQAAIHQSLIQKGITWIFNPPSASHYGGVWERLIRSTRKIIGGLVKEQNLDDESLQTLMCEAESIINGRPLTTVSNDPRVWNLLHQIICFFFVKTRLFLLVFSRKTTPFREEDGDRYNIWRTFFGNVGKKNICLCYNNDRSGSNLTEIFQLGLSLSSLMNLHPDICGRLVVSQKFFPTSNS